MSTTQRQQVSESESRTPGSDLDSSSRSFERFESRTANSRGGTAKNAPFTGRNLSTSPASFDGVIYESYNATSQSSENKETPLLPIQLGDSACSSSSPSKWLLPRVSKVAGFQRTRSLTEPDLDLWDSELTQVNFSRNDESSQERPQSQSEGELSSPACLTSQLDSRIQAHKPIATRPQKSPVFRSKSL